MSKLADFIEEYILRRISAEQTNMVILQRNEIAEEIECAPSQISYVLNTRFTLQRGFLVESRRGSGGFIRIVRAPALQSAYQEIIAQIDEHMLLEDVQRIVRYLIGNDLISSREAALIMQMATFIFDKVDITERALFLRSIFLLLNNLK